MSVIKTIDTVVKYNKESSISKSEKSDCVVRAMASAFDISYNDAHSFCKNNFGRKNNRGTMGTGVKLPKIDKLNNKLPKELGVEWNENMGVKRYHDKKLIKGISKRRGVVRGYTTQSFLKDFPKGTYIVLVRKHAFTIKDGVIYGNPSDGKCLSKRIKQIFEIN